MQNTFYNKLAVLIIKCIFYAQIIRTHVSF